MTTQLLLTSMCKEWTYSKRIKQVICAKHYTLISIGGGFSAQQVSVFLSLKPFFQSIGYSENKSKINPLSQVLAESSCNLACQNILICISGNFKGWSTVITSK